MIWTLTVLGMMVSLINMLSRLRGIYFAYNINAKSSSELLHEMPFPAITVCSTSPVNIDQKNISKTIKNYFAAETLFSFLSPGVNMSDPELQETTMKYVLDELAISDVQEFIRYTEWSGSGNITFQPVNTYVGKCFVANNDRTHQAMATVEGRDGGLEMILNIKEHGIILQGDMTYGARIFVHDTRDCARTVKSGVMVAPGSSLYISVKPTTYKFLPAPYKSYGDSYCEETDDTYSYEVCVSDWLFSQTASHCNCTAGMEPMDILQRYPSCSLRRFHLCYKLTRRRFQEQTQMKNFTACPKRCSFIRYDTSVSFSKFPSLAAREAVLDYTRQYIYQQADTEYVRNSLLKVTIYFDRFVVDHVVYEPELTLDSIMSYVGGQMGLFLGASLLTVVELGETIFISFWTLGKKLYKTKRKSTVASHAKP